MALSATFVLLLVVYHSINDVECKISFLTNLFKDGKANPEWSFAEDNDKWIENGYQNCSGKRQSPVNLYYKYANYTYIDTLKYSSGYFENRSDFILRNVKKFVTLTLDKDKPYIEGGGLLKKEKMGFNGITFQWSKGNSEPRGHRWASCLKKDEVMDCDLEMQMFHSNSPDTKHVVVASCFKAIQNENKFINEGLQPIVDVLSKIKKSGAKTSIKTAFSISSLFFGGLDPKKLAASFFFVYDGSIPFPPCDENTQYYFYRAGEFYIRQSTLDEFREIMSDNYRPTQEWDNNERVLYDRSNQKSPPVIGCR